MREEQASDQATTMGGGACPCCGKTSLQEILRIDQVPTNSCILLSTIEDARDYPRGDIRLVFCRACGFFFNQAFDLRLTEYSGRYEETQAYSGTFNRFHKELAERIIRKHGLQGGRVLEIGCGKGEFLALLAEIGDVKGVGVDPGVHPERLSPSLDENLEFIPAMFAPSHFDRDFDMVACKMTLEHIPDPFGFVSTIRQGIGARRDCVVFFQVPNALRILQDHAFEDVYYEHCAYFTAGSLARLFRRAGFEVRDIAFEYDDQYLTIEAVPAIGAPYARHEAEEDLATLNRLAGAFALGCARKIDEWKERVALASHDCAIWGSGSKAVAFLSAVDPERRISLVTDINPHRHGHFMPTSAQRIVAPQALGDRGPDLVIAMNRIYKDEIARDLNALGVAATLAAL